MIPEVYRDNTTIVKNHSKYSHLGCVVLRCIIGILVINKIIPTKILLILSLIITIGFTYKYFKLQNIWKVFLRTIIVYAIIAILILKYNDKYTTVYGILIIVDALMGLQSRHIFDRLSLLK